MLMMKKLLTFLLLFPLFIAPTYAQEIDDYISIAQPNDWIDVVQAGVGSFDLGKDNDRLYRLVDHQRKVTATKDERYSRDVTTLLSSDAVDDYGTITISFNPAYQTIILHHVRIKRAPDVVIDVTQQGEMQLYRLETDRENLVYDGRLELAYFVPQLKQGDTLDYAYTRYGRNPALGPHWQQRLRHGYSRPTQVMHKRLLVGEGNPIFFQAHNGAPDPDVKQLDGYTEYSWLAKDVPSQRRERDAPDGYRALISTTASSIENWSEIGKFFAPLYDPVQFQSPQIDAIASKIRDAHDGDKRAQLRAALSYVQDEVRYTGVLLGVGGYVPRSPSRILARGFGDCKDMTVLLTSILHALEIKATPFLVDTNERGGVTDDRPRIAAFNHVVVRATTGGKNYILDPTRGKQLGDLEHVQQGHFGKGVVIASDSVGMIDAPIPQPEFYDDIVDTFDFTTDPTAVMFTSKAVYSGQAADRLLDWVEKDGEADVEKNYLKYFKDLYPSVELAKPLTLNVDKDKAVATLTTHYKLTNPWTEDDEENGRIFWTSPDDLLSKFPDLPDAERKTPLALTHPVRFRHRIVFITDKSWGYERDTIIERTPAFDVKMVATGLPGRAVKTYTYVTHSDRILPKDLPQARTALKVIDDVKWTRVFSANESSFWSDLDVGQMTDQQFETAVTLYIATLVLIQLLVVSYRPQPLTRAEMTQQTLYPVSTTKFVIMSVGTMSFYTLYWFWQNWRWLREVADQDVSPFWRGFVFSSIWNLSLFPRIVAQDPTGRKSMARWATPLAAAYLILNLINYLLDRYDSLLTLSLVIMLLSILVGVPIQREVLRKNADKGKWVRRNSAFGWQAIAALILWSPMLALSVFGAFAS